MAKTRAGNLLAILREQAKNCPRGRTRQEEVTEDRDYEEEFEEFEEELEEESPKKVQKRSTIDNIQGVFEAFGSSNSSAGSNKDRLEVKEKPKMSEGVQKTFEAFGFSD